jgi:uncharacterized repeat protein (TIGR03803 family)
VAPGLPFTAESQPDRGVSDGGNYRILFSFNGTDGGEPQAGLVDVGGMLYGATRNAGAYGAGTVFSISTTGNEKVLHSFGNGNDGYWPEASLIDVNGTLYGTTARGGTPGCGFRNTCGTVFSITRKGKEKVLHSFGSGTDGWWPEASLTNVNGTLYGTTAAGGAYGSACGNIGCGTVFSISTTGSEKVLHSFGEGADGALLYAGLIALNGRLYGTTAFGGAYDAGTVFKIGTTGQEKLLHSFAGGTDGARPTASLIDVNGTLFGTTSEGGGGPCGDGCGTVFSMSSTGQEKVLLTFDGTDGAFPMASLVHLNGRFYGTTFGGAFFNKRCVTAGCGTLFSVNPTGSEVVLHVFGHGRDGYYPDSALIEVNGTLYGTTPRGGALRGRNGTVFVVKP